MATLMRRLLVAGLVVEAAIRMTQWTMGFIRSRTELAELLVPGEAHALILLAMIAVTDWSRAPSVRALRMLACAFAVARVSTTLLRLQALSMGPLDDPLRWGTGVVWPLVVVVALLAAKVTSSPAPSRRAP